MKYFIVITMDYNIIINIKMVFTLRLYEIAYDM